MLEQCTDTNDSRKTGTPAPFRGSRSFVRLFYVKLLCDGKSVCAATPTRRFRQTAAQAPALEGPERPFSDKVGAPTADIRRPFTATLNVAHRRALSVRQFGGKRMTKKKGRLGWRGRAPRGLHAPLPSP